MTTAIVEILAAVVEILDETLPAHPSDAVRIRMRRPLDRAMDTVTRLQRTNLGRAD